MKRSITYWATTGLTAAAFGLGGLVDLARGHDVVAAMQHLGYPVYFAAILGAWKLLGALAVLAPRTPRLKEWAYAGMFFDLSGAAVSHAVSGDPLGRVTTPLAILVLVVASWALRPAARKLASASVPAEGPAPARVQPRPLAA